MRRQRDRDSWGVGGPGGRRERSHACAWPTSWQQSQPPLLPRVLAPRSLSLLGFCWHPVDLGAALLSHFTEGQTELLRERELRYLATRTPPSTTVRLRRLLQGPLPCRQGTGREVTPKQEPTERWGAAATRRLPSWRGSGDQGAPLSLTHTLPWAPGPARTHHMVDGQGGGGDADVEAAAGLGDRRARGHGAAVPSSEALRGKKPSSRSRTEKGKLPLPSSLPSCPSDRQGQGRHNGAGPLGGPPPAWEAAGPCPSRRGLPGKAGPAPSAPACLVEASSPVPPQAGCSPPP